MHRGCFVWTPTPPLAGPRTPRPGPVPVCVFSSFLAGFGGPASQARSGAPQLFLWPLCLSGLLGPLFAGVAPFCSFGCLCFFLLRCSLCAPPLSLAFSGFRPRLPWALALCFSFHPRAPSCVFFLFSLVVRCAPLLSLAFSGFRPRVPWALALCVVCFIGPPLLGSACALAAFLFPAWPFAAPWWFLPPPPLAVIVAAARCSVFFLSFFLLYCVALACLLGARRRFSPSAAPPPPTSCCLFCWSLAARLSVCSRCFCVSRPAFGCSLVGAAPPPPPPPSVSCDFRRCRWVLRVFFLFPSSAALPKPACLVLAGSSRRLLPPIPPPTLLRAWCLVLSGVAALRCASVGCFAGPCCRVSLVRGVVCYLVLVPVAVCCAVLCVLGCGAAPRCCAFRRPVLCCCLRCCFVALVGCRCLWCRALWRCLSPWGPVLAALCFAV